MTPADSQVRVKVYQLDSDSAWADMGTGFCTLEDYQGVLHLNVVSETELNRVILDCVVQPGEVYQRQEATMIVWTEPTGEDLALSFQEQEGCLSILNQITEFENAMEEHANGSSPIAANDVILPQPTMASLAEIDRTIRESSQSMLVRDKLVTFILNTGYFEQLHELHGTCEDLDADDELQLIYSIVRQIILLNDTSIFEYIIKQDNFIDVVSMLEYDPQRSIGHGTFRNFLQNRLRFKEVVPIDDDDIKSKIHQTFRLQYLKDVVLPQIVDDGTIPIINALIYFNNAQIASYLQHNQQLLKDIFDVLQDSEDTLQMRDVVMFVRQFSSLEDQDTDLKMAGIEVLLSVLEQDRALVRSYALAQSKHRREGATLVDLVIQGSKHNSGDDVQLQCWEILRSLLDTSQQPQPLPQAPQQQQQQSRNTAENEADSFDRPIEPGMDHSDGSDADDFLALFYGTYVHNVMEPLLTLTTKAAKPNHLKLAALKFVRACVGIQDDSYNKYLVGHRLFDPVIALYLRVYPRDNLISSACRELFGFIAANHIASLLSHLINVHAQSLGRTKETLAMLRKAYSEYLDEIERIKAGAVAVTPTVSAGRRSALSINNLIGQETQQHSQGTNGAVAGSRDLGLATWVRGSAEDEMEDAYLEALEDDSDDSCGMSVSQSPEIKGLKDCLELYSDVAAAELSTIDIRGISG
ncbi:Platinum sensitivity protein [Coemansia erecta]|uniref:Platinum sensitivity protein n=1 Tax=Coemansia erecta TaxID=147472 RepID=A0A9W7Y2Z7_9FUNG|nr:Platinum sensitivity protein [Coemansia erecta]